MRDMLKLYLLRDTFLHDLLFVVPAKHDTGNPNEGLETRIMYLLGAIIYLL